MFKKTVKTRMFFFILADIILIAFSVSLSFLIRFDSNIPSAYYSLMVQEIILSEIIIIPIFYYLGLYTFSWAYASANELISLFKGTTIAFSILGVLAYILRFYTLPRSTILISYFLVFILCGAMRFSKRIYLHTLKIKGEKVLIVGAGDAGEQILRSIIRSRNNTLFPVGFVDDDNSKQGLSIHGLRVLGKIQDIPKIVKNYQVSQLIIALASANSKVIKSAVNSGREAGLIKIKIIPSITKLIDGNVSIRNLKDVEVEDLLGRDEIKLDRVLIERFINQRPVLITGAAGSIGSELSRQIAGFNPSLLILLDQDETGIFNISSQIQKSFHNVKTISLIADIRDEEKIDSIFEKLKPSVVFHAAAYKHVPLMEENPDEAVKNNIFGTQILTEKAIKSGVEKFVFISSDKAINPASVMGATKRAGEMICQVKNQINHTKFISVRFGNVLDSRGSVIPTFREQIKRGGPIEVTHADMKRYFMLTSEACLLVMQAGAMGKGGEVFVLDMGKPVKIVDLAREMIKLSGFQPDKDIPIVFTGIRPGEKLFEEILTKEEGAFSTQNQKIFTAKLSEIKKEELENNLLLLKKESDSVKIKDILKKIIPEYKN